MVVEQDELQNECRSRETCSFGTPDAVVCKAARSASAVLARSDRCHRLDLVLRQAINLKRLEGVPYDWKASRSDAVAAGG